MTSHEAFLNMARQGLGGSVDVVPIRKRPGTSCPSCGERIHPDSSICCICGQVTYLSAKKDPDSAAKTSPLAVASLILGCFSMLIVPGVMAIALGHVGLAKIRKAPARLRGRKLARAGLLLAYIGTGLGLYFLVAYGYPSFLWYRKTVDENAAIDSVQVLNVAIEVYGEIYKKGFPESLSQLGPPSPGARLDSNAAGLVRPSLASGRDSDYIFTYTITSRNAQGYPAAYTITADPAKASSSDDGHFFTNQDQSIRKAHSHAAGIKSPVVVAATEETDDSQ